MDKVLVESQPVQNTTKEEGEATQPDPCKEDICSSSQRQADEDSGIEFSNNDPIDFSIPDSASNILYADDGAIKGATLSKLVQKLTSVDSNVSVVFDFLLTYRSYTTPQYLLAVLRRRFEQVVESEDTKIVRLRVMNFMKQWIERHTYDWNYEHDLISEFISFIDFWGTIDQSYARMGAQLTQFVKKAAEPNEKEKKAKTFNAPPPPADFPNEMDPSKLSLLQIGTLELARQLSLIEWKLWENIKPWEFLNQNWTKKKKDELAPNILAMIKNFNKTATWVSTEILRQDNLKDRIKVISKFIQVAEECRILANFNAVMEILSGLGNAAVFRLKQTWESLPKPTLDLYESLKALMSPQQSSKKYRDVLRSVNPPTIPYLGISLTDLTFIYDGSKDNLGSGLLNFSKCRMVAQQIKTLRQYQDVAYHFVTVPVIRDYLCYPTTWDDTTLYSYSLFREPRPGTEAPAEPPSVVKTSEPPPWENGTGFLLSSSIQKPKVVKEAPKEWKSPNLVIRKGIVRGTTTALAIKHLLYISETDPINQAYESAFFTFLNTFGGLNAVLDAFEGYLNEAPLEDVDLSNKQPAVGAGMAPTSGSTNMEGIVAPVAQHIQKPVTERIVTPRKSPSPPVGAGDRKSRKVKPGKDGVPENETNISAQLPNSTERKISPTSNSTDKSGQQPSRAETLETDPYPQKTKKELTMRILEICILWGTRFVSTPDSCNAIQTWIETKLVQVEGMKDHVTGALRTFSKTLPLLALEASRRQSTVGPKTLAMPSIPTDLLAIRHFPAEEIARQLALWLHSEFDHFTKEEVFHLCSNKNKYEGPYTLQALSALAASHEKWVRAEMDAVSDTKKKRPQTFELFIEVAQYSLEFHNYVTCRVIYNVLSDPSFEDLVDDASKKVKDTWHQLQTLMNGTSSALNDRIAKLGPEQPAVISIIWLESSFSAAQAERDNWKNRVGIINFDKIHLIDSIWRTIESAKHPYNFIPCLYLRDYISSCIQDISHGIPLHAPNSARERFSSSRAMSHEGDEESNTETDNDYESHVEEDEDCAKKEKSGKKVITTIKGMFGRKKESASLSSNPNVSATNDLKKDRKDILRVVQDRHTTEKVQSSKPMTKQNSSPVVTEKSPSPSRVSRGSSGSSSSLQTSDIVASNAEFKQTVLKLIQEDEEFRAFVKAAVIDPSISTNGQPSLSPIRHRKISNETKIAQLEAKVAELENRLLTYENPRITDSE